MLLRFQHDGDQLRGVDGALGGGRWLGGSAGTSDVRGQQVSGIRRWRGDCDASWESLLRGNLWPGNHVFGSLCGPTVAQMSVRLPEASTLKRYCGSSTGKASLAVARAR